MCCGGSGSVDLSMRVTAQQDPCLCSIVSERTGSEQHNRRHVTHPSPKRAPCIQSASVNAGHLMHDVCGMLTMFSSRTGWQEDVLHDFHCRRGRVRGCWLAPGADILACILPLDNFFGFYIDVLRAAACLHRLHMQPAWMPSTPAKAIMHRREAVMCACSASPSFADMVRRSLRPQSHAGDRSLCCSRGIAHGIVCSPHWQPRARQARVRAVQPGRRELPEQSAAPLSPTALAA